MHGCDWEWPTWTKQGVGGCRNGDRERVLGRRRGSWCRQSERAWTHLASAGQASKAPYLFITQVLQSFLRNSSPRLDVNQPPKGKSQARFLAAPNPFRGLLII